MHFLYPSNPLHSRQPDDFYAAEFKAIRAVGHSASVFSLEELQAGSFCAFPALPAESVIYRGWMLSEPDYKTLVACLFECGAKPFTETKDYLETHHLPNWYPSLAEFTPETKIYPLTADLAAELRSVNWPKYFIKDYVKSLKTSIGSIITTPEQASIVAAEMLRFRGSIEGGFCVRRVENFLPGTEQRYFVFNSIPYAASGSIPTIVADCAKLICSRFYSVDVVQRDDGVLRIVEIGDGQVSDLVGWDPEKFASIFNAA